MTEVQRSEGVFDSSPTGWLLSLLFFPSGVIALVLILILLKRSDFVTAEEAQEEKIVRAGGLTMRSDGKLRALRPDEIQRVISEYRISVGKQRELEKSGDIKEETCGYCMGTGVGRAYIGLPCGHYHHARCVKLALEQDLSKCGDCKFCMKTLVL